MSNQREKILVIEDDFADLSVVARFADKLDIPSFVVHNDQDDDRLRREAAKAATLVIGSHDNVAALLQTVELLTVANPAITLVVMGDPAIAAELDKAHHTGAVLLAPKPVPFPVFKMLMDNGHRLYHRERKEAALSRLRKLLLDWFNQSLAEITDGTTPDYRGFFEGVFQNIRRVVELDAAALFTCSNPDADWQLRFDTGGLARHDSAIVRGDQSWFRRQLDDPTIRTLVPGEFPLRYAPYDKWQASHIAVAARRLTAVPGALVWLYRRTSPDHPFQEWEINLLNETQYLISTLLSAIQAFQKMAPRR